MVFPVYENSEQKIILFALIIKINWFYNWSKYDNQKSIEKLLQILFPVNIHHSKYSLKNGSMSINIQNNSNALSFRKTKEWYEVTISEKNMKWRKKSYESLNFSVKMSIVYILHNNKISKIIAKTTCEITTHKLVFVLQNLYNHNSPIMIQFRWYRFHSSPVLLLVRWYFGPG